MSVTTADMMLLLWRLDHNLVGINKLEEREIAENILDLMFNNFEEASLAFIKQQTVITATVDWA